MYRALMLLALFMSGCTTLNPYKGAEWQNPKPTTFEFQDPLNRTHSEVVMDQARCGALNQRIENGLEQYYKACMDLRGYKFGAQ